MLGNTLFEHLDYTGKSLTNKEFELSNFNFCNFSDTDLSNTSFTDCTFFNCNLSNSRIKNTAFKDVKFRNCKLLGIGFHECNNFLLHLDFSDCQLNLTLFLKLKLKNTCFLNCIIHEADFTETDLTGAKFTNCDLQRTTFVNSILEKADFRSSFNYIIDPDLNKIKKARFSIPGVLGLLSKYNLEIE